MIYVVFTLVCFSLLCARRALTENHHGRRENFKYLSIYSLLLSLVLLQASFNG